MRDRRHFEAGLAIALLACLTCLAIGVVVYYLGILAALVGGAFGALLGGAIRLLRHLFGG